MKPGMTKKRGVAMVMVMLALGVLAVATLSIVSLGNQSLLQSRNEGLSDEALYAAQAGLNLKVAELRGGDENDISGTMTHSATTYDTRVFRSGESPWTGFTVPGADTFYLLSEGVTEEGRSRRIGMLVQRSSSSFSAAILAGDTVDLEVGSYTDTFDSSNPMATLDHTLANIGLWSTSGSVNIDNTSRVGLDGGVATADIIVPSGGSGAQVTAGSAGTQFNSVRVDSLLAAPSTITARPYSGPTIDVTSGTQTLVPTLSGGEWVFRSDELKVQGAGSRIVFDISGVPNGQVAHFDVGKVIMESNGTIEIFDGGLTDAVVELYAENEFKVEGGSIINPSLRPDRMKLFCRSNDIKLEVNSATYVVAQSNTEVIVENGSAIYGSVAAPKVKLQDGSAVHYDQSLATTGTGGSSFRILSFQQL